MHLLLPILVLCSAIFRRVFLALRSPSSLREPLLQLRCHHLALATQLALAQKSTFLKIFLLFYPSYTLPSFAERRAGDDRANNGTTPRQQKVLFIKIATLTDTSVVSVDVMHLSCQMPLSISFTPLCKVSLHSRTSAKMSHR